LFFKIENSDTDSEESKNKEFLNEESIFNKIEKKELGFSIGLSKSKSNSPPANDKYHPIKILYRYQFF